jgi:hypothetical protein
MIGSSAVIQGRKANHLEVPQATRAGSGATTDARGRTLHLQDGDPSIAWSARTRKGGLSGYSAGKKTTGLKPASVLPMLPEAA